jgi:hypothetical protein
MPTEEVGVDLGKSLCCAAKFSPELKPLSVWRQARAKIVTKVTVFVQIADTVCSK